MVEDSGVGARMGLGFYVQNWAQSSNCFSPRLPAWAEAWYRVQGVVA